VVSWLAALQAGTQQSEAVHLIWSIP